MTRRPLMHFTPRLMKIAAAAEYIAASQTHFRRLVERGVLPQPLLRGGERLWDTRDLDEHAESLPQEGAPNSSDWVGQAI